MNNSYSPKARVMVIKQFEQGKRKTTAFVLLLSGLTY